MLFLYCVHTVLDQNLFSLITKETCFTLKIVRMAVHCSNHDRNVTWCVAVKPVQAFTLNKEEGVANGPLKNSGLAKF